MNDDLFAFLVEAFIADDIQDADRELLSQAVASDPQRAQQLCNQVRVSMLVTAAIGSDRSAARFTAIQHTIALERPSQILRIWGAVKKRTTMTSRPRPRAALGLVLAGTIAALIAVAVMLVLFTPPPRPQQQLAQPAQPAQPHAALAWQDDRGQRYAPGARIAAHQPLVLKGPGSEVVRVDTGAVLDLPDHGTLRLHTGRLELRSAHGRTHNILTIETPHLRIERIPIVAADQPDDGTTAFSAIQLRTTVADGRTRVELERGRIRATSRSNETREFAPGDWLQAGEEGFQLPTRAQGMLNPTQWQLTKPPQTGLGQLVLTEDPLDPARQVLRIDMAGDDLENTWLIAEAPMPQARVGQLKAIRLRYWPIRSSPDTRFNVNVTEHDGDAWAIFEDALVVSDGWLVLDIPWQAINRLHHGDDGNWSPDQGRLLGIGMAKGAGTFLFDNVEFIYE